MFLRYIHLFRAIAIIFIVAGHTDTLFSWEADTVAQRFAQTVFRNGSLMFVFIAGFLFQHLLPKYEIKKYYLSKLKNVISPYLIISIPAILRVIFVPYEHAGFPETFLAWNPINQALFLYLTGGHLMALWFIPMIAIFYLIAPLLVRLDRDGRIYWLLPALYVIALFMHRPAGLLDPVHSFLLYLPIYLLGMWSARNIKPILAFVHRWQWPMLAGFIVIVLLEVFVLEANENVYAQNMFDRHPDVIDFITVQKTLLSFLLLYYLSRVQEIAPRFLDTVAEISFGIFFVHSYAILASQTVARRLDWELSFNVPLYFLYTAFVIALVSATILIVKRLTGPRSRFLVGA